MRSPQSHRGAGPARPGHLALAAAARLAAPFGRGAAARLHFERGLRAADDGGLEEAADAFAEAVALDPNLSCARFNLAVALSLLGRHPEAAEAFAEAFAGFPATGTLSIDEGRLGWEPDTGAPPAPGAVRVRSLGRSTDARLAAVASLYESAGLVPVAASLCETAARAFGSPDSAIRAARLLERLEGRDDAILLLEDAVRDAPGHSKLLVALGRTLSRAGRLKEAERTLAAAIAANPSLVEARRGIEEVQAQLVSRHLARRPGSATGPKDFARTA